MHIADLGADVRLMQTAQTAAHELLASDPLLAKAENAPMRQRIKELFEANADSMN